MLVHSHPTQSIRIDESSGQVFVIDQRRLPFDFMEVELKTAHDAFIAIRDMVVRGAPLIGVTAAFGFFLGLRDHQNIKEIQQYMDDLAGMLKSARPTAVNLEYAVNRLSGKLQGAPRDSLARLAFEEARQIYEEELDRSRSIGFHGLKLIQDIHEKKMGETVNVLTHCNAGWLACIDYGTALAPVYEAWNNGIPVHVWVDETRPRNQGARLTVWELKQHGIPCTLITDNAGGHLMQKGKVDLVIVGTDRTAMNGDVVNKIGTYQKALAAFDNNIPFYVAAPSTSIDPLLSNGNEIVIEERDGNEIRFIEGVRSGKTESLRICPVHTAVSNPGFDLTPARLINGLITERGVCNASREGILGLFEEWKSK
ncbi:MAG: S-methyl-5-thioribose-1-phosphate isomerase [Bacteroidales bacterium]